MTRLEHYWYRSSLNIITVLLFPFSLLFRLGVSIRRFLYWAKLKKTYPFPVPIVVIGNITVGGTGKTPFVIWLANFLITKGFKPGIVSRGMGGRQSRQPRWVDNESSPKDVGDEAILLKRRSTCPVVIGIDRVAAVKELLAKTNCNIVISDDGLQHYRLGRHIEIALIDGMRGFGNKCFLPAGPLRESQTRLDKVDFVVRQTLANEIEGDRDQYSMHLAGNNVVSVQNELEVLPLTHFQNSLVHAVAAIGNPHRFFDSLRTQGFKIIEHIFPDHYLYQARDFEFGDKLPIVMTEKDAVKCKNFADERFWFIPVDVKIAPEFETVFCQRLGDLINNPTLGVP